MPAEKKSRLLAALGCTGKPYDMLCGADKADTVLVSYGAETEEILAAAELLRHQGMAADCCKLVQVYPLPDGLCRQLSNYKPSCLQRNPWQRAVLASSFALPAGSRLAGPLYPARGR